MEMSDIYVRSTGFAFKMLERMFRDKVSVTGVENIPENPCMFVGNHFTRLETLILPYFVNKHTNKMARSLADKKIFVGGLGDYLVRMGTMPTDNPHRNEEIIGDLLKGENNWIIYPEGNMIKNKKVLLEGRKYMMHLADKVREMHTGAAVMAIKSQLLREDLLKKHDEDIATKYFVKDRRISELPTAIVPVNITYYPLRGGDTKLEALVKRFIENPSARFDEELEIEGNVLAGANIHIHFSEPIFVDKYIAMSRVMNFRLPIIDKMIDSVVNREKRHDVIVNYYRGKLTNEFMRKVYENTYINLDHVVALTLMHHKGNEIHSRELRSRIYMNIKTISHLGKYRMHPSCKADAFRILAGRNYPPLKSALDLAFEERALIGNEEYEFLQVNHDQLDNEYEFHNVRQHNLMRVFCNELATLTDITDAVKRNASRSIESIDDDIFEILYNRDLEIYDADYKKYAGEFTKPYDIGKPFFLPAANKKIGVVLSHGYKAAPEEVRELAEYLNRNGMNVYCVRLHGHGTSPINLSHTSWLKWYDSYMRGVVMLQKHCEKIVFAGFSTGGLLSLYAAAKNATKCDGVISINAALKLKDIRTRLIKFINVWDDLTMKFRSGKGAVEYIDDEPENPQINYSRNYLKGVEELGKLMKKTKDCLEDVHAPALIMQSPGDPIVNPKSGKIIYNDIHSRSKTLVEPKVDKHVIVRGDVEESVFKPILEFIKNTCMKQN